MYGLAVEHCQEKLVQWNGDNGSTYWFQSEIPYDAPIDWNYNAYCVDESVNNHIGIGLGAYTFIYDYTGGSEEKQTIIDNAFKTPKNKPGIKMTNLFIFNGNSLGGKGGFLNIWNDKGTCFNY